MPDTAGTVEWVQQGLEGITVTAPHDEPGVPKQMRILAGELVFFSAAIGAELESDDWGKCMHPVDHPH